MQQAERRERQAARQDSTCPFCQKRLKNRTGYVNHIRQAHPVEHQIEQVEIQANTTVDAGYVRMHSLPAWTPFIRNPMYLMVGLSFAGIASLLILAMTTGPVFAVAIVSVPPLLLFISWYLAAARTVQPALVRRWWGDEIAWEWQWWPEQTVKELAKRTPSAMRFKGRGWIPVIDREDPSSPFAFIPDPGSGPIAATPTEIANNLDQSDSEIVNKRNGGLARAEAVKYGAICLTLLGLAAIDWMLAIDMAEIAAGK